MHKRTCPRCSQPTAASWCCGIDLLAGKRWRMTRDRIRLIHVLARARKGLTEEEYRLRLAAVGVETSLRLSRIQFHQLLVGLRGLPDSPRWIAGARHASRRDRLAKAG